MGDEDAKMGNKEIEGGFFLSKKFLLNQMFSKYVPRVGIQKGTRLKKEISVVISVRGVAIRI